MAIDFGIDNGSTENRYYEIADGAGGLNLPDSDWFVGFWLRFPNGVDTGNAYQYPLSVGTLGSNGSLNIFIDDETTNLGDVNVRIRSNSGSETISDFGNISGVDTTDRLLIIQRRSGNLEVYFVTEGATVTSPTFTDTAADSAADAYTLSGWRLGWRADSGSRRQYRNVASEFFIVTNGSLTANQVETMAVGAPVTDIWTDPVECYLPFNEPDATVEDQGNDHDATRFGTGITTATHPFTVDDGGGEEETGIPSVSVGMFGASA